MPYVSKSQAAYMNIHKKEIGPKVVAEFNAASKGKMKDLPEHMGKPKMSGSSNEYKKRSK